MELGKVKIINYTDAKNYLEEAAKLNPGDWVAHSKIVADCAGKIAENCGMNSEFAYCIGLLHDIGRRYGITGTKHIYDGYQFLLAEGYEESVAKICITHSFPLKSIKYYIGKNDCSKEETNFIAQYLESTQYSDYDKLIQLCDALAYPTGACYIEKRLVDVTMRHGFNEYTVEKWKSYFSLKDEFDQKCSCASGIYTLFPIIC